MSRQPQAVIDYWKEHYIDSATGLCSLCGNTGEIGLEDEPKSPAGFLAAPGMSRYCICPNGHALRDGVMLAKERMERL
jgi:hypothetical protein